jgi:HNH endonuclease
VASASSARDLDPAASQSRLPLPGRADALLFMAEASLKGHLAGSGMPGASGALDLAEGASPEPCRPGFGGDRYRILIHLSESLVGPDGSWDAFLEDGTLLSAEAFRRVSCDGGLVPAVVTSQPTSQTSEAGGVLKVDVDVGRQSRAIPAALRRALWLRDAGCRFPGCANRRFIHGHHLRHWAHGGETSLENLTLLCSFHHRLVHEGGFRVRRDPESGALEWFDPPGRPIPHVPSPGLAADQTPSLLALGERGIALPLDANINACGWDGVPLDYEAIFDALVCVDPLFAPA